MAAQAPAAAAPAALTSPVQQQQPQNQRHAILLIQTSKHDSTRFYADFKTMNDACEMVLRMYETRLKEMHPGSKTISYDITSLNQYIDDLREVCVLMWEPGIAAYKSWDRRWLKSKLADHLVAQRK